MKLPEMPEVDAFSSARTIRESTVPTDDASVSVKPRGYVDNDTDD